MTPEEFIAAIGPAAQQSMAVTGIPASFTIAEGALESGWGKSQLCTLAKNIFGVKADASWHGDFIVLPTREYLNGDWVVVDAKWRSYPDWLGCIEDHAAFLMHNKRYTPAFQHTTDGEAFTLAVASAGYATDPAYAGKIISIMRSHDLHTFDLA